MSNCKYRVVHALRQHGINLKKLAFDLKKRTAHNPASRILWRYYGKSGRYSEYIARMYGYTTVWGEEITGVGEARQYIDNTLKIKG